jgi:cold shock CspA family protein
VEFDEPRGWGSVRSDEGGDYPFHATAISDGSRVISPGVRVVFLTAPGHLGRMEARQLVALIPSSSEVPSAALET